MSRNRNKKTVSKKVSNPEDEFFQNKNVSDFLEKVGIPINFDASSLDTKEDFGTLFNEIDSSILNTGGYIDTLIRTRDLLFKQLASVQEEYKNKFIRDDSIYEDNEEIKATKGKRTRKTKKKLDTIVEEQSKEDTAELELQETDVQEAVVEEPKKKRGRNPRKTIATKATKSTKATKETEGETDKKPTKRRTRRKKKEEDGDE